MTRVKGPLHFRIHHFLGLYLGTFAGIVSLTGSVAVISHELQWFFVPATRASAGEADSTLGQRWDAARAAHPEIILGGISVAPSESGRETYFATIVQGRDECGREVRIYVDPVGAIVRGASSGVSFPRFMRGLHYYLFDVTGAGFYFVGILGPLLLIMMVTGLRTYRGWRKGFAKLPRRHQRKRSWWGSLHRLLGIWSLLFLPVIGVTVVWYLLEWDGLLSWESEEQKNVQVLSDIRSVSGRDIDRWVTGALTARPELRITNLWLPWEEGLSVGITGQAGDWMVRERANNVAIDPVTHDVVKVTRVDEMGWKERWTHTADPLHFGGFGGLWSKLVWFASGLILAALCFSGVTIYCLRRASP